MDWNVFFAVFDELQMTRIQTQREMLISNDNDSILVLEQTANHFAI